MKQLMMKFTILLAIPVVAIGYTNCSNVAFDNMELSSEEKKLAINQGGIVINDDAAYTNKVDVNLRLIHNSAEEMYITNDPNCESGGQWEAYKPHMEWKLDANNAEGKVFVRYRETGSTEIVSGCYADSIIHDDIAPVVKFGRQAGQFFNTPNFRFEVTYSDNLSGVGNVDCDANALWKKSACNLKQHVLVEGVHTIRASATDRAGNKSEPIDDSFTIDLTKPTVRFVQTPPAITSDSSSTFAFVGEDKLSGVEKYECSVNGGAFAACSSPVTANFPEGDNKYAVRVYDRAGNVSNPATYEWEIDKTAPSVQITKNPPAFSKDPIGNFEFTGKDGGMTITKFECRIGSSSAWTSCNSPHDTVSLPDGTHRLEVRGYDRANNPSSPANYEWTIDTVKPLVVITAGPSGRGRDKNVTFQFNATDPSPSSGIESVSCRHDSGAWESCSNIKSYTNIADGTHKFEVKAKDRAGNESSVVSHSYTIDTQKPVVTITKTPASLTNSNVAPFEFIATDAGGGTIARIECQVDGGGYGTCTSPKTYSNVVDGSHLFQVRAYDDVGNVSDVKSYQWVVDTQGPEINILKRPASVVKKGDPMPIHYQVTDAISGVKTVKCGLNGVLDNCAAELNINLNLEVGEYVSRIEAEDQLGNRTVAEIRWKVEIKAKPVAQNISVNSNNKVDVLVVVDNSGSMEYEQQNMAARFGSLLDKLQGLDWRVGVITTDMDYDSELRWGRLIKMQGTNRYYIDSSMDYAQAKAAFAATVQRPTWEGSSWEQGIRSTYYSIARAVYWNQSDEPNSRNRNFYRDDAAALSVVLVSDAHETYRGAGEDANRPEHLVSLVRDRWPNKAFSFHSIVVKSGDDACLYARPNGLQGNEQYGTHYETMSALTGGVVGSVCAADYSGQLGSIGQATVDQVRSATLDCAPLDTNGDGKPDVQIITSNGAAAPGYSVSGLKITFAANLPPGANELKYSCLAD
ncbi:MAG: hypothetical protein KF767_15735 [Bdellovibrionaceae bacterium]|nr:hypothetical protein [Pseudobdellovibrionaceae bacterium]